MGAYSVRFADTIPVDNVSLLTNPKGFTVVRSNGDEDPGHVLCLDGVNLHQAVRMKGWTEEKEGKPLASKRTCNYNTGEPAGPEMWRILLIKREEGKDPIWAWRQLEKVRPDGMSMEEAVAWREKVITELDKLETQ
jgi:hypothetical protein